MKLHEPDVIRKCDEALILIQTRLIYSSQRYKTMRDRDIGEIKFRRCRWHSRTHSPSKIGFDECKTL